MSDFLDRLDSTSGPAQAANSASFMDRLASTQAANEPAPVRVGTRGDVGEAPLQMITGALAAVPAGLGGIYQGIKNTIYPNADNPSAADRVNEIQDSLTYQPKSAMGKAAAETLGYPGRKIGEALDALGESNAETSHSPAFGAAVKGVAGLLPSLLFHEPAALPETAPVAGAAGTRASVGAAGTVPVAQARAMVAGSSPELQQAVESAVAKLPPGQQLNMEALQRHVDADSLPIPVKLTRGQATQDPTLISNERNTRSITKPMVTRLQQQDQALSANLDAIKENAAPDIYTSKPEELGQKVIDDYQAQHDAAQADIGAKYKALEDANGGDFPIDGNAFVSAAQAALKAKMKGRYVPPEIAGDMEDIKSSGGRMTFEDFENMRTNLASEMRKAERSGDGNRAYASGIVRNALEDLPLTPEAAGLKSLADEARAAAKADFDKRRADPAYDAVVTGKAVPSTFIDKQVLNTSAPLENVQKIMGNLTTDEAKQAISAATLQRFKDSAVRQGGFSPANFDKVSNGLGSKLNEIFQPDDIQTLNALGNTARAAKNQPAGSFVNNSNTLTAALGAGASNLAEGAVNATVGKGVLPIGSWIRKGLEYPAARRELQQTLAPGAGITYLKDMAQ